MKNHLKVLGLKIFYPTVISLLVCGAMYELLTFFRQYKAIPYSEFSMSAVFILAVTVISIEQLRKMPVPPKTGAITDVLLPLIVLFAATLIAEGEVRLIIWTFKLHRVSHFIMTGVQAAEITSLFAIWAVWQTNKPKPDSAGWSNRIRLTFWDALIWIALSLVFGYLYTRHPLVPTATHILMVAIPVVLGMLNLPLGAMCVAAFTGFITTRYGNIYNAPSELMICVIALPAGYLLRVTPKLFTKTIPERIRVLNQEIKATE